MVVYMKLVEEVIEVGPRKVFKLNDYAAVYLGKDLRPLIGRKVILIIKVLHQENTLGGDSK